MLHNLLPQQKKKMLQVEYRMRLANVCAGMLALVLLLGAIGLVPAYLVVSSNVSALEDIQANSASSSSAATPTADLRQSARVLSLLEQKVQEQRLVPLIDVLDSTRSDEIQFTGFSYDRTDAVVVLEGVAATREALVVYHKDLSSHELIASVSKPFNNLTKNVDLPFRLDVQLQGEE